MKAASLISLALPRESKYVLKHVCARITFVTRAARSRPASGRQFQKDETLEQMKRLKEH